MCPACFPLEDRERLIQRRKGGGNWLQALAKLGGEILLSIAGTQVSKAGVVVCSTRQPLSGSDYSSPISPLRLPLRPETDNKSLFSGSGLKAGFSTHFDQCLSTGKHGSHSVSLGQENGAREECRGTGSRVKEIGLAPETKWVQLLTSSSVL